MKFTPEVIAALQVLKDNAENDFERHRIAVLEQDLTEPPKIEVVDDTHQKFLGIKFSSRSKGYYVGESRLHRLVWKYCFGDIPKNYEVHHKDRNKANNDISNLSLELIGEHQSWHRKHVKKKTFICKVCGKKYQAVDNGKNAYCSSKCHGAYYRRKYKEEKNYIEKTKCEWCGKEFEHSKYNHARFCSQKCISSATYYSMKNNPFIEVNKNR